MPLGQVMPTTYLLRREKMRICSLEVGSAGVESWGEKLRNHRAWDELLVVEDIVREGQADGGHFYANFRSQQLTRTCWREERDLCRFCMRLVRR